METAIEINSKLVACIGGFRLVVCSLQNSPLIFNVFSHIAFIFCRISFIPRRYIYAFKEGLPVPDDDDANIPATPKTPNRAGTFAATKSKFELPGMLTIR